MSTLISAHDVKVESASGDLERELVAAAHAQRPAPYLEGRGLTYRYRGGGGVSALDLQIGTGELVALLGPNGAGKSTTVQLLVGRLRPRSGEVYLEGQALGNTPLWVRARAGVSYLPQGESLFSELTVLENIAIACRGSQRRDANEVAEAALELAELTALADRKPHHLSGGERRRVALARAFAARPKVLLVDEPFAALDPLSVQRISGLLRRFTLHGMSILLTDHRVGSTLKICDWVYLLMDGRRFFEGTAALVRRSQRVQASYLGVDS